MNRGAPTSRAARALLALLCAGFALDLALLALGTMHTARLILAFALAAGVSLLCALRASVDPAERRRWAFFALAGACWALGALLLWLLFAGPGGARPVSSGADVAWLLFYPAAIAGVLATARAAPQRRSRLDCAVAALALCAAAAASLPFAALAPTGGSASRLIVEIAYPCADLLALAALAAAFVRSGRSLCANRSALLALSGVALLLAGDWGRVITTALHERSGQGVLEAGQLLGLLAIGFAAWAPRSPERRELPARAGVALPVALGAVALGVLLADHFQRTNALAVVLAAAALGALALRLVGALEQARQIAAANAHARDHALEASAAKSMFVATVSHELRSPLNGVIGMTSLLLDTELDRNQREYAEIVRSSGEGLLLVINDILDFSKIEAGKVALDFRDFSLRETVGEACAVLLPEARRKGLELDVAIGGEVPAALHGDGGRIRQVLTNLVSNAVKFTSAGSVTVRVSARPQIDEATLLRVEVADTGIGIPRQTLSRLFQPFTQADSTTTRRFGGTGLGLAISAQLVKMMGGLIGADSVPGRGSTFWFELVLDPVERPGQPLRCDPDSATSPLRGARDAHGELLETAPLVLVAEDSVVNQLLAVRLLDRLGYRAETVSDGREAVAAAGTGEYAAVLMDCEMPELDGYGATQQIRRDERGLGRIPIIAMTAHSMAGDREKCLEAGMDDYVSKPIRAPQLADVLGRVVVSDAGSGERQAALEPHDSELDEPLIDDESLVELGVLEPEELREVLEIYFADVDAQVRLASTALASQDAAGVSAAAHRIKGASLTVGASLVSKIAASIEQRARTGELGGAEQLIPSLADAAERTRSVLLGEDLPVASESNVR